MVHYVDLDSLPASTLRHLAALREQHDRRRYEARYADYETMAEELALMLCAGRRPTIGWYRRRLRHSVTSDNSLEQKSAPLGGDRPPAPPLAPGPM
jgi:hypothetical protein